MNESQQQIVSFLYRIASGEQLVGSEQLLLKEWANKSPVNADLLARAQDEKSLSAELARRLEENTQPAWERLLDRISQEVSPALTADLQSAATLSTTPTHRIHFLRTAWFKYAAAILILLGSATYLYISNQKEKPSVQTVQSVPVQNDVLPGSDKAILTLSNGQKVQLNSIAQQTITDGKLSINNENGMLTYGKSDVIAYNNMTTPKGGQYRLTLPDGTNVWLNAASSITYPTSFSDKQRMVSIKGEAYFEVAKNPKQPFIVKAAKDEITVLGTHFNVNAYSDDPFMKTTLLEGAVRINNTVLKPGQAYINGLVVKTDIQQDIAWKNGIFNFNGIDLEKAINQVARWYDVNVIYEREIPNIRFAGKMGRDLNLSQVLKALDAMGLKFTINGKNLTVKSNN